MNSFIFKVTLEGTSKPIVWRRIAIPANIDFEKFHFVLQSVFEWANGHLYQFSPKGWASFPNIKEDFEDDFDEESFSKASTFPLERTYRSNEIKLQNYFKKVGDKIVYIYDFGDNWEHKIVLEEISEEILMRPKVLKGKGAVPPEDCGGIPGYYDIVEILKDPENEDYNEMRTWLMLEEDENWDENDFDLQKINKILTLDWDSDFEDYKYGEAL